MKSNGYQSGTQTRLEYPTNLRGNVRVNSAALSDQGSSGHRSLQLVPLPSPGGGNKLVKSGSLTSMGSTVRPVDSLSVVLMIYRSTSKIKK